MDRPSRWLQTVLDGPDDQTEIFFGEGKATIHVQNLGREDVKIHAIIPSEEVENFDKWLTDLIEFMDSCVSELTQNDSCAWRVDMRMAHHEPHEHLDTGTVVLDLEVTDFLS
jgi:hypothetical protein